MTEKEFDETVNNIYDVYDFCRNYPTYDSFTDNIYCNEDMVEYIKDLISDINFGSVQELVNFTDDIPFSDWYLLQDGEIFELYFDDLKSDLLETLKCDDFFTPTSEFTDERFEDEVKPVYYCDKENNTDTDENIIANDISVLYL